MSCQAAEHDLVPFLAAGTLAGEESASVRAHLSICPDCREELRLTRQLVDGMRQMHLTADEVVTVAWDEADSRHVDVCSRCRAEVELVRNVNTALGRVQGRSRRHVVAIGLAATLTVVVAGSLVTRESGMQPPDPGTARPSNAASPPPPWSPRVQKPAVKLSGARALVFRRPGSADGFLTAFGAAIEPYRRDDFAAAAERLRSVHRQYPRASEPAFYLGVSLLLAERPAEAVAALEAARSSPDGTFAVDAEWYLAVAHYKAGSPEAAAAMLETLCAGTGPFKEPACAGLATLAHP